MRLVYLWHRLKEGKGRNDSLAQFPPPVSLQPPKVGKDRCVLLMSSLGWWCDSGSMSIWGLQSLFSGSPRLKWYQVPWVRLDLQCSHIPTDPLWTKNIEAESISHLPAAACSVIVSHCGGRVVLRGVLLGGDGVFKMGHRGMSLGQWNMPPKRPWTSSPPLFCISAVLCGPEKDLWQIYGSHALGFRWVFINHIEGIKTASAGKQRL